MIDHHLQKSILDKLILCESAHFAELKPPDVESNVFTYHLQQLVKQKIVCKGDDGCYSLTARGKAIGINSKLSKQELYEQAHSVLFMALRNKDGEWLLRRRLAQPMFGKLGFVHGEPVAREAIEVSATRLFAAKTGLQASFTVRGCGYIKIFKSNELESFTHFTLLLADAYSGTLLHKIGNGENEWIANDSLEKEDVIASTPVLLGNLESKKMFFEQLEYNL